MQKIFIAAFCALITNFAIANYVLAIDERTPAQIGQMIAAVAQRKPISDGPQLMLSALRSKHPRLIILPDDVVQLNQTIAKDPLAKKLFDVLKQRADEMLTAQAPEHFDNSGQSLAASRLALKHVTTLAGMFRLTGDHKYFSRARDEMLDIARFSDWAPTNFLCVAEMTAAMAIGYDWLYDQLSPEERLTICGGIVKNGLLPGLAQYKNNAWWTTSAINWNLVCNSGLSLGALAVATDEPDLSEKIVECTVLSLPIALKTFAPDGGWPEGPGYWAYGTRYLTYLLASLQTSIGCDFDFSNKPGIADTAFFRIYSEGPLGQSFNFADSETEVPRGAQMFWLSRRFNQPVFAGAEVHITELFPEMFHLLFYCLDHPSPAEAHLPLNKIFSGINVAFFRSRWNDPQALYVGFKGGDNHWSHSHADLGSFVFDAAGYRWAEDLGPDDYELPGYFKNLRFSYYRLQTQAHNTLTIASANQPQDAHAQIIRSSTDEVRPFSIVDLKSAYPNQFDSIMRGIAVENGKQLIVQDEFESRKAIAPLIWHFHTKARVTVLDGGKRAMLVQGEGTKSTRLKAQILSCPGAIFTVAPVQTPREEAQQPDVSDLIISINLPDRTALTRLVVVFSVDEKMPTSVKPLAKW
ncbi:MAG: heparinase II/III family protein [Candidatus Obscuribacterales bacterium]|nr:heparinase II/III family protein [Candidatus Obscuribacterales bacterium]